jgi:hypothetical protein
MGYNRRPLLMSDLGLRRPPLETTIEVKEAAAGEQQKMLGRPQLETTAKVKETAAGDNSQG